MQNDTYDVLVIGAGPGGYPAAIRAAQLGLSVACVEKEKLGGVCLNWGCIPSKALLESAKLVRKLEHADRFGLKTGPVEIDFALVIARSRQVAGRMEKGVAHLFKKYGVTTLSGTASLRAPGQVAIASAEGERLVRAKHVILATGARPKTLPGIVPDGERVVTYRELIVATEQPRRLTVVGAGAIGIELAYFFAAMGSEVVVVEALDEILPLEDRELGATCRKELAKQGIDFRLGSRVRAVRTEADEAITELEGGELLRADRVLVALGIQPNVEGLGLEALGVAIERTGITVDASQRTSVPGVYAVGDVCSRGPALAHVATRQAHVCVERIAGHEALDIDYDAIPSCTYCEPQVASVGLSEARATERGLSFTVGRFPFLASGKAQGARDPVGFVKVLVDTRYGEILGAHIVGGDATELVAELTLARTAEATASLLVQTVHAHPTRAEAVMEAVASALGASVHL